jgi:hypothetical protein
VSRVCATLHVFTLFLSIEVPQSSASLLASESMSIKPEAVHTPLPPELLDSIVWWLRPSSGPSGVAIDQTLLAFSRVSHAWNASARVWIFRDITLDSKSASKFLNLLSTSPHIQAHVQVMRLTFNYDDHADVGGEDKEHAITHGATHGWAGLPSLTGKLPNLDTLKVLFLTWSRATADTRRALTSFFTHARKVCLQNCFFDSYSDLDVVLLSFPHLEVMHLHGINYQEEGIASAWNNIQLPPRKPDAPARMSLQQLRLSQPYSKPPLIKWILTRTNLVHLGELILDQVSQHDTESIGFLFEALGRGGCLRSLRFEPHDIFQAGRLTH